jgi:hypothetical protein
MADIEIKRIARREAEIRIIGTAPLIVHRFDEKARGIMLDAQQGRKKAKEPRDPEAEAERALHRLPDGAYGFPATGFKAATVGGSRYFNDKKLSQVLLKQAIFVVGEGPDMLVRLDTNEPKTREDVVRIGMGTANLCYRPMFDPWAVVLRVVYVPSIMSLESVIALVDAGGLGGVGEWRPSSKSSATGVYGTFAVDETADITERAL